MGTKRTHTIARGTDGVIRTVKKEEKEKTEFLLNGQLLGIIELSTPLVEVHELLNKRTISCILISPQGKIINPYDLRKLFPENYPISLVEAEWNDELPF